MLHIGACVAMDSHKYMGLHIIIVYVLYVHTSHKDGNQNQDRGWDLNGKIGDFIREVEVTRISGMCSQVHEINSRILSPGNNQQKAWLCVLLCTQGRGTVICFC